MSIPQTEQTTSIQIGDITDSLTETLAVFEAEARRSYGSVYYKISPQEWRNLHAFLAELENLRGIPVCKCGCQ